jgi:hypothetical protein
VVYMHILELLLGEYGSGGGGNGNGGRLGGLKVEFRKIGGLLRCLLVYL